MVVLIGGVAAMCFWGIAAVVGTIYYRQLVSLLSSLNWPFILEVGLAFFLANCLYGLLRLAFWAITLLAEIDN